MTPLELVGFPELKSYEDLQNLREQWQGDFELREVSEITGIGWGDD